MLGENKNEKGRRSVAEFGAKQAVVPARVKVPEEGPNSKRENIAQVDLVYVDVDPDITKDEMNLSLILKRFLPLLGFIVMSVIFSGLDALRPLPWISLFLLQMVLLFLCAGVWIPRTRKV